MYEKLSENATSVISFFFGARALGAPRGALAPRLTLLFYVLFRRRRDDMGWELRLFYHGDLRDAFEAHAAQALARRGAGFRRKGGGEDELRTDVYVR